MQDASGNLLKTVVHYARPGHHHIRSTAFCNVVPASPLLPLLPSRLLLVLLLLLCTGF
jgi:hypothetical protein